MTTDAANDTEAVKTQVTEFLKGLMKQSTLHFTDFFEAVQETIWELEFQMAADEMGGEGDD